MPPEAVVGEPADLLLGAVGGPSRYRQRQRIARAAAGLINDLDGVLRNADLPEDALQNLFNLCAGLACPEELGVPLARCYWTLLGAPAGWLEDLSIRLAFRRALLFNQIDDSLVPEWLAAITANPSGLLRCHPVDAWEGLLRAPNPNSDAGEPDLDRIGEGMEALAYALGLTTRKYSSYRKAMLLPRQVIPGRDSWDQDLVLQAHHRRLPRWAVDSLPSLAIALESEASGWQRWILWQGIVETIPWKQAIHLEQDLCEGRVLQVALSPMASSLVALLIPHLESCRITFELNRESALEAGRMEVLRALAEPRECVGRARGVLSRFEMEYSVAEAEEVRGHLRGLVRQQHRAGREGVVARPQPRMVLVTTC